jgi:hypothetical protein
MINKFIRNKFQYFIVLIMFFMISNILGKTDGGLILTGIDTLRGGFDFVLQRPCTSSSDVGCNAHFAFLWDGGYNGHLARLTGQGRMLDLGKLNLDSIKSAPADSVMKDDLGLGQPYMFFKIAPDSLSKCIGNVYLLKTGNDPRPAWNRSVYAKIKIIKFIVLDSAQHQIKMVFLWAFNRSGYPDLTTAGLDTFHLNTPVVAQSPVFTANRISRSAGGQQVFKVVGDRFVVPAELSGPGIQLVIYDLKGKKVGKVAVGSNRIIDLRVCGSTRGVVVVKIQDRY